MHLKINETFNIMFTEHDTNYQVRLTSLPKAVVILRKHGIVFCLSITNNSFNLVLEPQEICLSEEDMNELFSHVFLELSAFDIEYCWYDRPYFTIIISKKSVDTLNTNC